MIGEIILVFLSFIISLFWIKKIKNRRINYSKYFIKELKNSEVYLLDNILFDLHSNLNSHYNNFNSNKLDCINLNSLYIDFENLDLNYLLSFVELHYSKILATIHHRTLLDPVVFALESEKDYKIIEIVGLIERFMNGKNK